MLCAQVLAQFFQEFKLEMLKDDTLQRRKELLKSRDSIVGRTGKSLNFARNLASLDAHLFNPFGDAIGCK